MDATQRPQTQRAAPPGWPPPVSDEANTCADCGTRYVGNFCPRCGQESLIETPTVRHFVREAVDQFIAIESKLWRTLRMLITQPGALTDEYLRGRRQRYVRPFKLYLTISVVFFSLFSFMPGSFKNAINIKADNDQDKATAEVQKDAPPEGSNGFEKWIVDKMVRLSHPDEQVRAKRQLADEAPYAMFFLMPYFAALLRWFYRSRKRLYGEHLLFSVHLHTFGFMVLMIGFLPLQVLHRLIDWILAVYLFFALREFYGGGWVGTLWRMGLLYVFYVAAVAATAVSGVVAYVLGNPA